MKKKSVFMILLTAVLITACGKESISSAASPADDQEVILISSANDTPVPTVTSTPIPVAEMPSYYLETSSIDKEVLSNKIYSYKSETDNKYRNTVDSRGSQLFSGEYVEIQYNPYYVGKENDSFLERNKGNYDEILYLTDKVFIGNAEVKIENEEIIVKDDFFLVPLKQGITSITIDGVTKKYAVTTANDGKDISKNVTLSYKENLAFMYNFDGETWRQSIHTIRDMVIYLCGRNVSYTFNEPIGFYGDGWDWCAGGEAIAAYNEGVCKEDAQLACYMLANDFEDWGTVLASGPMGHVFNWFYEDGIYYIVDFTDLTSANNDGSGERRENYCIDDLENRVNEFMNNPLFFKKCTSLEEVQDYIINTKYKIGIDEKAAVLLVENMGRDYFPIHYCKEYCSSKEYEKVVRGEKEGEIVFEEILQGHVTPLYIVNTFKVSYIPTSDIPMALRTIKTACYGPQLVKIR